MSKINRLFLCLLTFIFISSALGCDAFVRKFTREKKKQDMVEPVLTPDENAGLFYDNETKYKNYFAYWRAWQDELIQSMYQESDKRKLYCINQAIENLELMAALLTQEHQKEINEFIAKMNAIRRDIESESILNENMMRQKLVNIRLSINNKLHYVRVKDWIKK